MTSGKAELCNEIKNTELQSKCMDNIIFGQAASKQDPKKCLEIKSSDFQGSCISALVSMNIKTPPTLESCSIANTPEAKSACEDFINL